jgi:hypothetical protein
VLRSCGPNHSKPSRVHVLGDRLARQAKRLSPFLILGFRTGAFRHPAGKFSLRHLARQVGAFISRFTNVRGTIPHISDASIITAFRQGVRDEKMLEKLATHDVETVPTLFALADKCARTAEGRAWHSAPQTGAAQLGGSGAIPRDGKKKKKKDRDYQKSRSTALVVAAATEGRGDRNKRPRP